MNKTVTRKKHQYINNNTVESLSLGRAVVQSLGNDVAKGMAGNARDQLFGVTSYSEQNISQEVSGDLTEGQELYLTPQENNKPKVDIEPGIDYFKEVMDGEKRIIQENAKELSRRVEEVLVELQRLITASEELKVEFREITIEQRIVSPGKYHLNFFEWILSVIRLARMKIEDSGAWLATFQSKKTKRQYWAMFKKHGTTFGLSNERVVATQTG